MYSITNFGAMIADRTRMHAFAEAMRRVITPGSVVIDLGAGPGLFALLACRFGARRVYAIEPADVIQVAREIAAANGLADRIEFIQAMSTDATVPERADVIVSDIGGVMPWFQAHLPSIADARRRLLKQQPCKVRQRDQPDQDGADSRVDHVDPAEEPAALVNHSHLTRSFCPLANGHR